MIHVRCSDGITFRVTESMTLKKFTREFEKALYYNKVIELENDEGKIHSINPWHIIYFEKRGDNGDSN